MAIYAVALTSFGLFLIVLSVDGYLQEWEYGVAAVMAAVAMDKFPEFE